MTTKYNNNGFYKMTDYEKKLENMYNYMVSYNNLEKEKRRKKRGRKYEN